MLAKKYNYNMLNFKEALKTLRREEKKWNVPVPDLLSFLHVEHLFGDNFESNLNNHFELIKNGQRNASPLLKIDAPKSNYTIRPMARPRLLDWLLYEAVVGSIAEDLFSSNGEICSRSFSIERFRQGNNNFINAWLKFDEKCNALLSEGFNYVVVTDITGYFENISLDELIAHIHNFIEDEHDERIIVLKNLLYKWSTERILKYGLPQGPQASSFLGDFFLDQIDSVMEKYNGYYRYMDDIKIFCRCEIECKIALKELISSLRELKLNINAKKTNIWHDDEISKNLFDNDHDLMNLIVHIINSGNERLIKESAVPSLMALFYKSFGNDPFEQRHLNFSLFRLGMLYNSNIEFEVQHFIDIILSHLSTKPHHTGRFCEFLSNFHSNEYLQENLINFLDSKDNIYEWQEIKILQCLIQFNLQLTKSQRQIIARLCENKNKHNIAQNFYLILLGKNSTNRERNMIVSKYDEDDDEFRKMAIIIATQELGNTGRNRFYTRIRKNDNDKILDFVNYIKSLENPLYCLKFEKPRIKFDSSKSEIEFEPSWY